MKNKTKEEYYIIKVLAEHYGFDADTIAVDGGFNFSNYIYWYDEDGDCEYLLYGRELTTKDNLLDELDMYLDKKYMAYRNAKKRENIIKGILDL